MINNRYKILSFLGEGRNKTFLCEDTFLNNKKMALKVLNEQADSKEERKFKEEFLTLRRLSHKHIIKAFDYRTLISVEAEAKAFNFVSGSKFYTMEYIDGVNISKFYVGLNENLLIKLIVQISSTLYYLHTFNYLYKDLKVENILVTGTKANPCIYLIDFGGVISIMDANEDIGFATNNYLAPEYLIDTKTKIDKRVDLYALGILIYYLMYKYFPFEKDSSVKLFRAHIDDEPDFVLSPYSIKLINLVKKLLNKNCEDRYQDSYEILLEFGAETDIGMENWIPPKIFVKTNLMMSLVNDFLYSKKPDKAIIIRGTEGAGKTSLLDEIYYNFRYVLVFNKSDANSNIAFGKYLLQRILFNPFLYNHIEEDLAARILTLIQHSTENVINEFRTLLIEICKKNKFIVLLDDFNEYSEKTMELLREIIPIFLIYDIKVIITEDSSIESKTSFIESPLERLAQPFDNAQLDEYLGKIFSSDIETVEIKKLLNEKTDMLPGSIDFLLRELFYNKIIRISNGKLTVFQNEATLAKIETNFVNSITTKLNELDKSELKVLQILSALGISIPFNILLQIQEITVDELERIIRKATDKNILKEYYDGEIEFYSNAIKRTIYNTIKNKNYIHETIAEKLTNLDNEEISKIEIANQYEKGGDLLSCAKTLTCLVKENENSSYSTYIISLLERIRGLNIPQFFSNETKLNLAIHYNSTGQFGKSIEVLSEISEFSENDKEVELALTKAKALSEIGELVLARELITGICFSNIETRLLAKVQFELANIEYLDNNISVAEEICNKIINNQNFDSLIKAAAINLIGNIKFQERKLIEAIEYFEKSLILYVNEERINESLKLEINIGTVYSDLFNMEKAKFHWEKASKKNKMIGNLEFEAFLLMNYGIYYSRYMDFESAIKHFLDSLDISRNIKQKELKTLCISNLLETYLINCEYENFIELLENVFHSDEIDDWLIYSEFTKYYIIIGDNLNAKKYIQKLIDKFSENKKDNYYFVSLEYLKIALEQYMQKQYKIDEIINLQYNARNINDIELARLIEILLFDACVATNKYDLLLNLLEDYKSKKEFYTGVYGEAIYNFYMAQAFIEGKEGNEKSNIEYLEIAYENIIDCSISELTWKILFALAEAYTTRGNLNKASEFIILTQQVINHIADKISSPETREKYLQKPERKSVLEKLSIWKEYLL